MSGFGFLFVVVIAIGVVIALGLRRLVFNEADLEADLHRVGAATLEFVVPAGADPAVARAALMHAGFSSQAELHEGHEVLVVSCPEVGDRATAEKILLGLYGPTAA